MYPRTGTALVPRLLAPHLIGLAVEPSLCERAGLPAFTLLADLDAPLSAALPDDCRTEIGRAIAKWAQAHVWELRSDLSPVIVQPTDVRDLGLSTRTVNRLGYADFLRAGIVYPCSISQLLAIPNFGVACLLEFLAVTEDIPPIGADVSAVPPVDATTSSRSDKELDDLKAAARRLSEQPWANDVRQRDPRLGPALFALAPTARDAAEAANLIGENSRSPANAEAGVALLIRQVAVMCELDLRDELRDIVASMVTTTHIDGILARLGFDGEPPVTLQVAGDRMNVSRERVRQICSLFSERVGEADRIFAPRLDEALRLCHEEGPTSVTDLEQLLVDHELVAHRFSIESLDAAAVALGRAPLPISRELGLVSEGHALPSAAKIQSEARRLVDHWGATTVEDVLAKLGLPLTDGNASLLKDVLTNRCRARWLDEEQRWFWMKTKRNRLLLVVRKIVSVAGSIEISELRDGVGRPHRMEGFRPPRAVLAALCADCGEYAVRDDRVFGLPGMPGYNEVLGANETLLADVLFEHGPVMRRADLEEAAVDGLGLGRNSFYVYLTYSPIIRRFAPGVFGLRGASVTAAHVQALVPPRSRSQVLRDHGWHSDGTFWFAYKISKAAETSGVLSLPGGMREVAQGRYALSSEDGEPVGTLVVEDRIWGLSSAFRRRGVEAGDYVVLKINSGDAEAQILVGSEDLLLRFQDGD